MRLLRDSRISATVRASGRALVYATYSCSKYDVSALESKIDLVIETVGMHGTKRVVGHLALDKVCRRDVRELGMGTVGVRRMETM